jgi:hypothetical protein
MAELIDQITVHTKAGFVWIQNIWETTDFRGVKSADYGHHGAASR